MLTCKISYSVFFKDGEASSNWAITFPDFKSVWEVFFTENSFPTEHVIWLRAESIDELLRRPSALRKVMLTCTVLANKGWTRFRSGRGISMRCSKELSGSEFLKRSRDKCCRDGILRDTHATWITLPVATNNRRSLCPHVRAVIGACGNRNQSDQIHWTLTERVWQHIDALYGALK